MITFAPMPPLAGRSRSNPARRVSPPSRATVAAAFVALLALAPAARAQSALGPMDDATPIPRGWLRFGIANAWTRYDSRFDANGAVNPLGAELSTDSLGPRQLPKLA